jgi:hypothetical protein
MEEIVVNHDQNQALNQREAENTVDALRTENQFKNGANWFYWIAGLSLINSLILYVGGNISFIVGFGITQLIDGIIYTVTNSFHPIGIIPNLIISGLFVVFGYYAGKHEKWAFIVGLIIYGLDSLIFLLTKQWLSFGFHVFAGFMILKGLNSLNKLETEKTV